MFASVSKLCPPNQMDIGLGADPFGVCVASFLCVKVSEPLEGF